eukprot:9389461-Prorocentrum_lima.AAC.1
MDKGVLREVGEPFLQDLAGNGMALPDVFRVVMAVTAAFPWQTSEEAWESRADQGAAADAADAL